MGEGWGDSYATAIRLKERDTRATGYSLGEWTFGKTGNWRHSRVPVLDEATDEPLYV